jgi:hypothetical protein
MTPVLPSPRMPAPAALDRVRMIRRSMRCFVFGLMGIVPLFGLGTAWLALRLWREVAEETGEPARLSGANWNFIAAFMAAVALLFYNGPPWYSVLTDLVLAAGILLPARQGWLLVRQYGRVEPLEWNPARHLVYWGAGLAYAGLVLSSLIIMIVIGWGLPPFFLLVIFWSLIIMIAIGRVVRRVRR